MPKYPLYILDCLAGFHPQQFSFLITNNGYIAAKSGHSHGSTVDLTIVDISVICPILTIPHPCPWSKSTNV